MNATALERKLTPMKTQNTRLYFWAKTASMFLHYRLMVQCGTNVALELLLTIQSSTFTWGKKWAHRQLEVIVYTGTATMTRLS